MLVNVLVGTDDFRESAIVCYHPLESVMVPNLLPILVGWHRAILLELVLVELYTAWQPLKDFK
jgi:hypothetical protein